MSKVLTQNKNMSNSKNVKKGQQNCQISPKKMTNKAIIIGNVYRNIGYLQTVPDKLNMKRKLMLKKQYNMQ